MGVAPSPLRWWDFLDLYLKVSLYLRLGSVPQLPHLLYFYLLCKSDKEANSSKVHQLEKVCEIGQRRLTSGNLGSNEVPQCPKANMK